MSLGRWSPLGAGSHFRARLLASLSSSAVIQIRHQSEIGYSIGCRRGDAKREAIGALEQAIEPCAMGLIKGAAWRSFLRPFFFRYEGGKVISRKIPGSWGPPSESRRTYVRRLMCREFITSRKKCSDPQLAVEEPQRNLIKAMRVQSFRITS